MQYRKKVIQTLNYLTQAEIDNMDDIVRSEAEKPYGNTCTYENILLWVKMDYRLEEAIKLAELMNYGNEQADYSLEDYTISLMSVIKGFNI